MGKPRGKTGAVSQVGYHQSPNTMQQPSEVLVYGLDVVWFVSGSGGGSIRFVYGEGILEGVWEGCFLGYQPWWRKLEM